MALDHASSSCPRHTHRFLVDQSSIYPPTSHRNIPTNVYVSPVGARFRIGRDTEITLCRSEGHLGILSE